MGPVVGMRRCWRSAYRGTHSAQLPRSPAPHNPPCSFCAADYHRPPSLLPCCLPPDLFALGQCLLLPTAAASFCPASCPRLVVALLLPAAWPPPPTQPPPLTHPSLPAGAPRPMRPGTAGRHPCPALSTQGHAAGGVGWPGNGARWPTGRCPALVGWCLCGEEGRGAGWG